MLAARRVTLRRAAALAAGAWAGVLLGVAAIGTPAGFALLPREVAGQVAGRMLLREAWLSIVLCAALFVWVRAQARQAARDTGSTVLGANVLLVLGALFCTVVGYFGLQPAMAAARAGQGLWSFGALHGMSMGLYALKTLLVLVLAWRLSSAG